MKSARLLGHEHHVIDEVAAIAEGAAAITLSRGGAPKTYPYTDPNEDAACFAIGPGGLLAAVADGHYGARGAACAIDWVLANIAEAWTNAAAPHPSKTGWEEAAASSLQAIHTAVIEQSAAMHLAPAPTTLSLVLVRPGEDLLVHASVGDSHAFRVVPNGESFAAVDMGWTTTGKPTSHFLGESYEGDRLEPRQYIVGCEPIGSTCAIVLASDGLSERGIGVEDPPAAAAEAVAHGASLDAELRPLETCKHLTEAAMSSHRTKRSGDNISAAVLYLET